MLEGLEINEISLLELKEESNIFRIDSEFFKKSLVLLDRKLRNKPHFFLSGETVVSGPFGSTLTSGSYLDSGIPFIRIENIKTGFFISKENLIYISKSDNERIKSSQLEVDDLILSKVGNTIGYYARVDEEIGLCNISENNIGIKLSNYSTDMKMYVLAYLNSKIGKALTIRRVSGNAQPKLNVADISEIPIPIVDKQILQRMGKIITEAYLCLSNSTKAYSEAGKLLTDNLGLSNWTPIIACQNVKTLKESLMSSGRLDAEYYQKKYDELFEKLSHFDYDKLSDIVEIKKSVEPGSEAYQDNGIPFIRVSDLTKFGVSKPDIFLSSKDYDIEKLKPRKDTILLSKDGSVGIAYKVDEDLDCITSGAILHLNVYNPDYIPDYLTLVLNSIVVQMQASRDAGGSIIQHWKPSEISDVVIPFLPMEKQIEISSKVQESFKLRHESKRLLEIAKQAVVIAISENETTAIKYIDSQIIN